MTLCLHESLISLVCLRKQSRTTVKGSESNNWKTRERTQEYGQQELFRGKPLHGHLLFSRYFHLYVGDQRHQEPPQVF